MIAAYRQKHLVETFPKIYGFGGLRGNAEERELDEKF